MKKYAKRTFTGERALFQSCNLDTFYRTSVDGESPLKESSNLKIRNSLFQWKYQLWYCQNINVEDSNITSVKNPYSGKIKAKHIGEIIFNNTKMKKEDIETITSNREMVQAI